MILKPTVLVIFYSPKLPKAISLERSSNITVKQYHSPLANKTAQVSLKTLGQNGSLFLCICCLCRFWFGLCELSARDEEHDECHCKNCAAAHKSCAKAVGIAQCTADDGADYLGAAGSNEAQGALGRTLKLLVYGIVKVQCREELEAAHNGNGWDIYEEHLCHSIHKTEEGESDSVDAKADERDTRGFTSII